MTYSILTTTTIEEVSKILLQTYLYIQYLLNISVSIKLKNITFKQSQFSFLSYLFFSVTIIYYHSLAIPSAVKLPQKIYPLFVSLFFFTSLLLFEHFSTVLNTTFACFIRICPRCASCMQDMSTMLPVFHRQEYNLRSNVCLLSSRT